MRDIPQGETLRVPKTWPGAPIYIDSPGYNFNLKKDTVTIPVQLKEVRFPTDFNYDCVTAALKVNAKLHNPLLCVVNLYAVASGDLSLPARWPAQAK